MTFVFYDFYSQHNHDIQILILVMQTMIWSLEQEKTMEKRSDLISECQQPFSPHKNRVVVEVIV